MQFKSIFAIVAFDSLKEARAWTKGHDCYIANDDLRAVVSPKFVKRYLKYDGKKARIFKSKEVIGKERSVISKALKIQIKEESEGEIKMEYELFQMDCLAYDNDWVENESFPLKPIRTNDPFEWLGNFAKRHHISGCYIKSLGTDPDEIDLCLDNHRPIFCLRAI